MNKWSTELRYGSWQLNWIDTNEKKNRTLSKKKEEERICVLALYLTIEFIRRLNSFDNTFLSIFHTNSLEKYLFWRYFCLRVSSFYCHLSHTRSPYVCIRTGFLFSECSQSLSALSDFCFSFNFHTVSHYRRAVIQCTCQSWLKVLLYEANNYVYLNLEIRQNMLVRCVCVCVSPIDMTTIRGFNFAQAITRLRCLCISISLTLRINMHVYKQFAWAKWLF